jgi:carbamoyl-phosphate synthase small subunit
MTYPEIGNYGVNSVDLESERPHLSGFIVRNRSRVASNYRSEGLLEDYLARHNVVGIAGVDTRALVRKLRQFGSMKGVLSTVDLDDASLVAKAKASPGLVGRDLVREVMPTGPRSWSERLDPLMTLPGGASPAGGATGAARSSAEPGAGGHRPHVVALDFGMKWNIPRHLTDAGFRVTILPGSAGATEVLAQRPDGVFLSNGPGDPEPLEYAIETIRGLVGRTPVFGICLGHQLLSLACGAKTFKLKFGHRGANQPVQNLSTGRVEITSQNHGFAVVEENLPAELEVTHRNLNDRTIEGVRHRDAPAFSVQYHPEASAGPHDSAYLFQQFRELIAANG